MLILLLLLMLVYYRKVWRKVEVDVGDIGDVVVVDVNVGIVDVNDVLQESMTGG